jgi:hypothetical protein
MARTINNFLEIVGNHGQEEFIAWQIDPGTTNWDWPVPTRPVTYPPANSDGVATRQYGDGEWFQITHFGNRVDGGGALDAGNGYIIEYRFSGQPSSSTGATDDPPLQVFDDNDNIIFSIEIVPETYPTDGPCILKDSTGTTIASFDGLFGASTAATNNFMVAIYYEYSASGAIVIYKDGVELANETGADLGGGSSHPEYYQFATVRVDNFGSCYWGPEMVMMSGCADIDDRLSADGSATWIVGFSQSNNGTATPDYPGYTDPFDEGTGLGFAMQLLARVQPPSDAAFPRTLSIKAAYTTAGAGADTCNFDPKVDWPGASDTILAAKATIVAKRSGGGGTAQHILFGNSTDGVTQGPDIDITTAEMTYSMVTQDPTIMPAYDEDMVIGFQSTGAQDFDVYAMAAAVLYIPGGSPSPPPLLSLPYKAMRHMIIR